MGDDDNNNNNKAFKANFTGDGVTKLRDKVNDKLKEFMGDYTDDTLVEYVIVLLKNGRSKAEAKNELNVFLGDDSDSFVSWLWDHLESSLHLYVQPLEGSQIKPPSQDRVVTNDFDKAQSGKLHRSRHNREWRSLVRDEEAPPPFKSTVADKVHLDEKSHHKVNRSMRSTSPQKIVQKKRNSRPEEVPEKKRNRPEEVPQAKRVTTSQGTVGPARRLLQFAVREAVATSKPSNSTSEPALKRLRSVVSISAADSSVENRPRRLRSLACVPNAMSTAMRAVEEAAKDVVKNNNSGNVFDRLGVSHASDQLTEFDESLVEDVNYGVFKEISAQTRPSHVQGRHYGDYHGDMTMLETGNCLGSDSASDNEGYDQVNVVGRRVTGASRTSTSGVYKDEDALMIEYSVDKNGNQYIPKPRKEQDQPATDVSASNKVLNISVNVNTWKPPHYQEQGETQQVANRKTVQNIAPSLGRSGAWSTKEKSNAAYVANGNTKPATDISKESEKILPANHGLYATGRPTEDVDSRTIFVSNVHFAATKDGLSRHFNKFGEVLKVIIVTDAATGQPKGSAYVEFMRKEAAENALSLDGTSFMSRILKVINKSSAHQDTAPIMSWPRAIRGSPFAPIARYGRGFFPRGNHNVGAYQARPPIIAGARSLQWKREETNTISSEEVNNTMTTNNNGTNASLSLGNRSLTYVRADLNTNGHSATPS